MFFPSTIVYTFFIDYVSMKKNFGNSNIENLKKLYISFGMFGWVMILYFMQICNAF